MPPQGDIVRVPSSSDRRNVGSPSRREIDSENHVWEGQNGATRRRRSLHVFTLRSTAGISLTVGKAYSFMSGQGCASASIPREVSERGRIKGGIGSTPATQRGPPLPRRIFPKSDPPYGGSESIPLHLSFCLDKKFAVRFKTPGTWTALRDKNLSYAQRRSWRACLFRVRDREHPWQFMWDTTAMLSFLPMTCECVRNGIKWVRARWTTLNSRPFMCQVRYLPDQTP